jgi:hypothetical protein
MSRLAQEVVRLLVYHSVHVGMLTYEVAAAIIAHTYQLWCCQESGSGTIGNLYENHVVGGQGSCRFVSFGAPLWPENAN